MHQNGKISEKKFQFFFSPWELVSRLSHFYHNLKTSALAMLTFTFKIMQ